MRRMSVPRPTSDPCSTGDRHVLHVSRRRRLARRGESPRRPKRLIERPDHRSSCAASRYLPDGELAFASARSTCSSPRRRPRARFYRTGHAHRPVLWGLMRRQELLVCLRWKRPSGAAASRRLDREPGKVATLQGGCDQPLSGRVSKDKRVGGAYGLSSRQAETGSCSSLAPHTAIIAHGAIFNGVPRSGGDYLGASALCSWRAVLGEGLARARPQRLGLFERRVPWSSGGAVAPRPPDASRGSVARIETCYNRLDFEPR